MGSCEDVSDDLHVVTICNGSDLGLKRLRIYVNDSKLDAKKLSPDEERIVDIAAYMDPGPVNTITFEGKGGKPEGRSALVWLADQPMPCG